MIITAGATGLGLAASTGRLALEPFVRPPEEVLPGEATWYASTCRQCPAGCGIIVRTVNGRAKKIEGNPLHPLNHGKLCARGQAGLQVLYNPDRLKNAVRQTGGRSSRQFEPLYWPDALDLLKSKITGLGAPDRLAVLSGFMPDHLYLLFTRLLDALGAPAPVIFDLHSALEGRRTATQLSQKFFGSAELAVPDLARTQVVLSFGASFLETWMSPVAQSFAYGSLRGGRSGERGFVVQFEPRLSMTAASADEWIPVKPGTEGLVALALGRIIVDQDLGLGHVGSQRTYKVLFQDVDVGAAAQASEVTVETLNRLARVFVDADEAIAIPGGYLAGQRNGLVSMMAVQALNLLTRQFGRVGGIFQSQPGPTNLLRQTAQVSSFDDVRVLIESMKDGHIDLLLIHGANPLYELPSATGVVEAIKRVPFVISFSPFINETTIQSDLILPDHTYLESWGYQVPMPGADRPTVSGQMPVVAPLYDTRATAEVLLNLATALGGKVAQALPWPDEVTFIREVVTELNGSSLGAYDAKTPDGFWAKWRQYGGWWSERAITREPELTDVVEQPLRVVQPSFDGEAAAYPFYLYPYPSLTLSDGRGANVPWLQETPDPMTTISWRTWVEINPATAASLGVGNDDVVRIISPNGEMEASVMVYPGIRPDVIAIPVGQREGDFGRFAVQRGKNPVSLVSPLSDLDTGSLAWGATRVRVEPTGKKQPLARLESLDGAGRESLS